MLIDNIKKQFILRKEELIIALAVELAAMLIGVVGFAINFSVDKTIDRTFEIGAISAGMVSLLLIFFVNMGRFGINFNYAVSMGRTRRTFMGSYMVVTLIHIVIVTLIAGLIGLVESFAYRLIYSGAEFEFQVISRITPEIAILAILIEVIVPMFIGMIIMKYGLKSVWIFWGFTMIFNFIPDKLINSYIDQGKLAFLIPIKDLIIGIKPMIWFGFGYILLLILLYITNIMVKKQGVTV